MTEPQLNDDVLEVIFRYLDFRSLCSAEMACRQWKKVINDRRLYWQLTKRLCARAMPNVIPVPKKLKRASEAPSRKRQKTNHASGPKAKTKRHTTKS